MVRDRALPALIGGRRIKSDSSDDHGFRGSNGPGFTVPRLSAEHVRLLLSQNRMLLADVPLQEILAFLNRAGKNWRSDEYSRRRMYVRQLQDILGYSEKAAVAEADRIAILLNSHSRMYDLIEAELGSRFVVDEWVPREESHVRALPRGLVVHILPGNVPLATAMSLLRALITKNVSVLKFGSSDPLTATALALSLADLDPDHPVTRAVSVVYWDHESESGRDILGAADAVVAWGGRDAIRAARRHAADDAPVTCFGPKHSLALVDTSTDPVRAARGLAHDVAAYDQQACFSPRRVFVTGPKEPFLTELRAAMALHSELLPAGSGDADRGPHIQLTRRLESFLGADVLGDETLDWTVVVAPVPEYVDDHPLARILYVHFVESLGEAHRFADRDTQTVAAAPWDILLTHRDELARRGVSRFVELGLAHLFRIGGAHDGVNSLQGLVRFASVEASGDVFGKGMVLRLDETTMLKAGTLKDFVL